MRRYEAKLTRFGEKLLSTNDDIEDLVQEVFIKAFVNIRSFDTGRSFSSWIYRIAHNHFVDALKQKRGVKLSYFNLDVFFPHLVASETTDSESNREELRRMLDQSLSKLDAKYKEPLILHYFESLGYKEISDVLQIPVSTVGVRLGRGKAMMKTILKQSSETNDKQRR
jgi:RNA polymerase sigma-70 factor (ECF subfamily)